MKKRLLLVLLCIVAVFGFCFAAGCNNDVKPVAITVSGSTEGETLFEYMSDLKDKGELSFEYSDSQYGAYVTAINGVSNTTNSSWMLYTDDAENSNTAWGTYEYEGKTLGSSALGAGSLVVVDGCVYVWVYETFSI